MQVFLANPALSRAQWAILNNQGSVRRGKGAKYRSRGKAVGKRLVRVPISKKPGLMLRILRFLLRRTKR